MDRCDYMSCDYCVYGQCAKNKRCEDCRALMEGDPRLRPTGFVLLPAVGRVLQDAEDEISNMGKTVEEWLVPWAKYEGGGGGGFWARDSSGHWGDGPCVAAQEAAACVIKRLVEELEHSKTLPCTDCVHEDDWSDAALCNRCMRSEYGGLDPTDCYERKPACQADPRLQCSCTDPPCAPELRPDAEEECAGCKFDNPEGARTCWHCWRNPDRTDDDPTDCYHAAHPPVATPAVSCTMAEMKVKILDPDVTPQPGAKAKAVEVHFYEAPCPPDVTPQPQPEAKAKGAYRHHFARLVEAFGNFDWAHIHSEAKAILREMKDARANAGRPPGE